MTKQDIRYEWQQIVRDLEGQTPHAASIAAQLLMAQKMDMVLDQLAAMTMKLDNLQAPAAPAEPSSPFKYKGNQMDKPKLPGKNAYCACPCEGWRHYPQPNNCDCENERGFPLRLPTRRWPHDSEGRWQVALDAEFRQCL